MYVRWLGAFRKNGSLAESLDFEFSRATDVACEKIKNRGGSKIRHCRLGLLVDPKAVYRVYQGDVWSEYQADGTLFATRSQWEAHSSHCEAFAKPVFTGLVIKGGSLKDLSAEARATVLAATRQYNLPLYKLVKGRLTKEYI